jgi:hypothetical protein
VKKLGRIKAEEKADGNESTEKMKEVRQKVKRS